MRSVRFRLHPRDVFDNPRDWVEIERPSSLLEGAKDVVVVHVQGGFPQATWLADETSFAAAGRGPFAWRGARYFRHRGEPERRPPAVRPAPAPLLPDVPVPEAARPRTIARAPELVDTIWCEERRGSRVEAHVGYINAETGVQVRCRRFSSGETIAVAIHWADTWEPAGQVSATVEDDVAVASWLVPQEIDGRRVVPKKSQFIAVARAGGEERQSGPLRIEPFVWEMYLGLDPDDPQAVDDELILLDGANREIMRVAVASMPRMEPDGVRLRLENVSPNVPYSLIRDYGPNDGGGADAIFVRTTLRELDEIGEEQQGIGSVDGA